MNILKHLQNEKSITILKFLGLVIILLYCYNQAITGDRADYKIFYDATIHFWKTKSVYNVWYSMRSDTSCQYLYSPFFLFLFYPLTLIPYHFSLFIWHLLNVYFLYKSIAIVTGYLPYTKHKLSIIIIALTLASRFILSIFECGQMNLFILYAILQCLYWLHYKKIISAAIILSISLIVKVLPLTLLPYLLYRKQYKAVGFTILFTISYLFIPSIYVGWGKNISLHKEWIEVINPNKPYLSQQEAKTVQGIHSITALYSAYFINNDKENYYPRHIFDLNTNQFKILLHTTQLFFILLIFYFIGLKPFREAPSQLHELWEISYLLVCTVIIFPHQQKYAFVFILPACIYLSYAYFEFNKSKKVLIFLGFLFLALTLFSSNLFFGYNWKNFTEYYKTITFAMGIIIGVLIWLNPNQKKLIEAI